MRLEEIDRAIKDSLQHGNEFDGKVNFTKEQIEMLSEAIKVAFETYHNQTEK